MLFLSLTIFEITSALCGAFSLVVKYADNDTVFYVLIKTNTCELMILNKTKITSISDFDSVRLLVTDTNLLLYLKEH